MDKFFQTDFVTFAFLVLLCAPLVLFVINLFQKSDDGNETPRAVKNNVWVFGVLSLVEFFFICYVNMFYGGCRTGPDLHDFKMSFYFPWFEAKNIYAEKGKFPDTLYNIQNKQFNGLGHYITDTNFEQHKRVDDGIFLWAWNFDKLFACKKTKDNGMRFEIWDYKNGELPEFTNIANEFSKEYTDLCEAVFNNKDNDALKLIATMELNELELQDMNGITPLMRVVAKNNVTLAKALLNKGVESQSQNIFYDRALDIAKNIQNPTMLELLNNYEKQKNAGIKK